MRYVLLVLLVLRGIVGSAQNLVPNGSFEEYTECPTNQGQVERALGWTSNLASPDYFNRCSTNDSMDVPLNLLGYQDAFDGNGYMGVYTYLQDSPTYRECIQHALSMPLLPGVPVYLSMMVSPGGFGNDPNNNSIHYASNGIGMKFSVQSHSNYLYWPENVALYLTSALNDTAGWVQVSGIYVPDSAYDYVTIGCFLPYDDISVETLDPNGQSPGAYAFVDQICISTNAADCPFSIGIVEAEQLFWNVGPNPVGEDLQLKFEELDKGAALILTDDLGRICERKSIPDGISDLTWSLRNLPTGSYFIALQNSAGFYKPIRIVHINP